LYKRASVIRIRYTFSPQACKLFSDVITVLRPADMEIIMLVPDRQSCRLVTNYKTRMDLLKKHGWENCTQKIVVVPGITV